MNTVADKSIPLHELLTGPEIESETLNQPDVEKADRYYGKYGYGPTKT